MDRNFVVEAFWINNGLSQALVKIYIHIFYKNDILNKIVGIFLISKPIKTVHCCFGKSPYDLKILLGAHNMDDKNITRNGFYLRLENPMVEKKKRICGRFHFFMLEGQKFAYRGIRPWKNASWQNFLDSKPHLTARRPF